MKPTDAVRCPITVRLSLVVLAACGSTATPIAKPAPKPIAPIAAPIAYQLPVLGRLAPTHPACNGSELPNGHRVYDFSSVSLYPIRDGGPKIREREKLGRPRSPDDIGHLLADRFLGLEACWKWASARGASPSNGSLAIAIDPLGRASDVVLTSTPRAPELSACFAEQLVGATLPVVASRTTRVTLPVEFKRANQPKWPSPPAKPRLPDATRVHESCGFVADDGGLDRLSLGVPLILSDFDGRREPKLPTVTIGCAGLTMTLDKSQVRGAVMENRGAFETCYAAAYERDHALTGVVELRVAFTSGGTVREAAVSGAGDGRFHACMTAAAKELYAPDPSAMLLTVNFPFELMAPGPEAPERTDLAPSVKILRDGTSSNLDRCRARATIAETYGTEIAPWLDDDRVRTAVTDLVRAAKALPARDAIACLEDAHTVLDKLVVQRRGGNWLDRLDLVAPVIDYLSDPRAARTFYAKQLAATSRHADAIAMLQNLAADATLSPDAHDDAAFLLATASDMQFGRCGLTSL